MNKRIIRSFMALLTIFAGVPAVFLLVNAPMGQITKAYAAIGCGFTVEVTDYSGTAQIGLVCTNNVIHTSTPTTQYYGNGVWGSRRIKWNSYCDGDQISYSAYGGECDFLGAGSHKVVVEGTSDCGFASKSGTASGCKQMTWSLGADCVAQSPAGQIPVVSLTNTCVQTCGEYNHTDDQ